MEDVMLREGLYGFEYLDVDKRRALPGERQTYEIKQLWQRNHEIVNLAAIGYNNTDIAEILNITPATVSNTLNSELGMHKLADIRQARDEETKKIHEKIRVLTDKALNVYHEIFDNESGEASIKDRKDAADTVVLELSGLRAPTKIQSSHVSTILTKEEIDAFRERGLKAAKESGMVIDAEVVE